MKPHKPYMIVGLGELIWDLLPGGKQLGGAPSNFAYASALLGDEAIIASRVGADELGRDALRLLNEFGISTAYIQHDESHPTGTVEVSIRDDGEAAFKVNTNSAWDYLELTPQWSELAMRADAVCFGTLGQRELHARDNIKRFLESTRPECLRVFDVNLRHSFFSRELLENSLWLSTIVKLSIEELAQVGKLLNRRFRDEVQMARLLIKEFSVKLVAITRGPAGSALVTEHEVAEHPGFRVKVVDTIGAGDAFAASLAHNYLRGASLEQINEAANRIGAWVATQSGATPRVDEGGLLNALEKLH